MAASVIKHLDLADLPVHKKDVLCKMLDRKDEWEDLARFMQFSEFDIEVIFGIFPRNQELISI